jgi:hypothetical protein
MSGASSGTNDPQQAAAACTGSGGVWFPDLQKTQASWSVGVLVKF